MNGMPAIFRELVGQIDPVRGDRQTLEELCWRKELLSPLCVHSAHLLNTCCVPGAMLGLGTSNEHHKLSVELRESDGEFRQQSNDLITK